MTWWHDDMMTISFADDWPYGIFLVLVYLSEYLDRSKSRYEDDQISTQDWTGTWNSLSTRWVVARRRYYWYSAPVKMMQMNIKLDCDGSRLSHIIWQDVGGLSWYPRGESDFYIPRYGEFLSIFGSSPHWLWWELRGNRMNVIVSSNVKLPTHIRIMCRTANIPIQYFTLMSTITDFIVPGWMSGYHRHLFRNLNLQ